MSKWDKFGRGLTGLAYLLIIGVPALVIVLVANRGESPVAEATLVRLLSRVDPHVDQEVSSLVEVLLAPHALEEAVARANCRVDELAYTIFQITIVVCCSTVAILGSSKGSRVGELLLDSVEGVSLGNEETVLGHVPGDQIELLLGRDLTVLEDDLGVAAHDRAKSKRVAEVSFFGTLLGLLVAEG